MWSRKRMGPERPPGHNALEAAVSIEAHKAVRRICKIVEHLSQALPYQMIGSLLQ